MEREALASLISIHPAGNSKLAKCFYRHKEAITIHLGLASDTCTHSKWHTGFSSSIFLENIAT